MSDSEREVVLAHQDVFILVATGQPLTLLLGVGWEGVLCKEPWSREGASPWRLGHECTAYTLGTQICLPEWTQHALACLWLLWDMKITCDKQQKSMAGQQRWGGICPLFSWTVVGRVTLAWFRGWVGVKKGGLGTVAGVAEAIPGAPEGCGI